MAPACVIDASAVVRIITAHPEAQVCIEALATASLVIAPELMLTEVSNVLWKLQRAQALGGIDPQDLLHDARDLINHVEPDRVLQAEALALACHLDHPVYDCLYLALARREAAVLLTADRRLQRLAEQVLP
ncbi:type II toxin-antitoxin system VapC family toxin [Cyanobium sp. ATX 6F1]|uniref:type II toxin-antitoxin system VapC family toxin n=1 Tax=unclassified Cyanobium TaxID=2627006 RepID=UPI0020CFD25C|nr:type II toxin-antitoxin system VapC family toxin [Cyanobium sp. ATX 6F1]MCP9915861.1 type II toxin-antitoxin system VapC family toxin [Cyanobium sp. ATX 6F1]